MIKESIPNIPNWPIEGVVYRDITGLVSNPQAFKLSVDLISDFVLQSQCDYIIAPDARGFIWSSAVVRKPGKLPPPTHSYEFDYEYAKTSLHIKADSNLNKNSNVVIIDDVNATGGTALAIVELLKNFDVNNISYACVVNLPFLNGSAKLQQQGINFFTTVTYDE
jgi:adenine phosphoribosyltransferase